MGALCGVDALPKFMVEKVVNFDCEGYFGFRRPEFLNVKKHCLINIQKLIQCMPKAPEKITFDFDELSKYDTEDSSSSEYLNI